MSWMLLWKIVLFVAVACFAIMTVVVTIGGALDVRRLFNKLEEEQRKDT
ncbi:MAG: hypothetical protein H6822_05810 [Planctomycetaceae bacterium]|nr:hypothetical protein [Planctomycetales bacterium]MCB9921675.1 hypothetical protein [Planctomycetaceae bacterium]